MHGPEDSNIIPRPKAAAVPIYPLLGWIQVANCTFRLPLYLFESSVPFPPPWHQGTPTHSVPWWHWHITSLFHLTPAVFMLQTICSCIYFPKTNNCNITKLKFPVNNSEGHCWTVDWSAPHLALESGSLSRAGS